MDGYGAAIWRCRKWRKLVLSGVSICTCYEKQSRLNAKVVPGCYEGIFLKVGD